MNRELARRAIVGPPLSPLRGSLRVRLAPDARTPLEVEAAQLPPDHLRCDRRAPRGWRCPAYAVENGRCADHPRFATNHRTPRAA